MSTLLPDRVVHLGQEPLLVLAGRLQQKLGPVTPHVLSQEVEDVFFQITGPQPFPEDDPVQRNVGQQPVMADPIEASAYIAFQDPRSASALAQDLVTLVQGVSTAALTAKAVGVGIGSRFHDR